MSFLGKNIVFVMLYVIKTKPRKIGPYFDLASKVLSLREFFLVFLALEKAPKKPWFSASIKDEKHLELWLILTIGNL